MPQTCSTFAAYSCGAFAANAFFVCKLLFWRTALAHNVRHKYVAHSCRALFWHTMCAASLRRTIVAHCSGTQCAPQVCSAQLLRTVLVHNVRRKFAAHNCRALFWYTMCATSLQRTIVAHCSGTQCAPQVCSAQLSRTVLCATTHTQLPCTALFPPSHPLPHPNPQFITPPPYIFLVPFPQGECEKKCGDGWSVTKIWGWGWEKM